MKTPAKWNSSSLKVPALPATWGRWQSLRRGVQLVLLGYLLLLALAGPGLFLWSVVTGTWPLPGLEGLEGKEAVDAAGQILLIVGGVAGFLLILVGQWCCLLSSPQSNSAKEWTFICILLALLVPVLNLVVPFVGGAGRYDVLERLVQDPTDASAWKELPVGTLLRLASGLMGVLNVFFYTQFLRVVLVRLEEGARAKGAEAFTMFLGLLLGASVGACFAPRIPMVRTPLFLGLGAAWVAGLAWHVALIFGTSRRMRRALAPLGKAGAGGASPAAKPAAARGAAKRFSGLHSLFRLPAK
jgi:hypothetical protein